MTQKVFDFFSAGQKAPRVVNSVPSSFRVAQYPDGSRRTQGAYVWQEGFDGGVEWKDLPLIIVNENGTEVTDGNG